MSRDAPPPYRITAKEVLLETPQARATLMTLAPGQSIPPHRHSAAVDHTFCLSGTARLFLGNPAETLTLTPGDRARVPPGRPHALANAGAVPLRVLLLQGPGAYDFVPEPENDDLVKTRPFFRQDVMTTPHEMVMKGQYPPYPTQPTLLGFPKECTMSEKTDLFHCDEKMLTYDAAVVLEKIVEGLRQRKLAGKTAEGPTCIDLPLMAEVEVSFKEKSKPGKSKKKLSIELAWKEETPAQ